MGGLTVDTPVLLSVALASARIIPGDTLLLRGGTYTGDYKCSLNGTEANPITIKPYNGEHVIIDGSLELRGNYLKVYDIDFTDSSSNRTRPNADETLGVYIIGVGCGLYGCTVSDMHASGITFMGSGAGEVCENIVLNNGVLAADGNGHGHGLYGHNNLGGARLIARNSFFGGLGNYNLQLYGTGNAIRDFTVEDNVFHGNPVHTGGEKGLFNCTWHGNIQHGSYSQHNRYCYDVQSDGMTITDNVYIDLSSWTIDQDSLPITNLTESGNVVYGGKPDSREGYTVTEKPATKVWVTPFSKSERWVGMLVIYNRDNAETVVCELTGIPAGSYKLRNTQNPDETCDVVWDGETPIDVPTDWHTRYIISTGWLYEPDWATFGALMIEKT